MPIIRWKFKSARNEAYKNINFSGIDISVSDLCDLIMKDTGMKPAELKLQIFDASTGEEYKDYSDMVPRNKSVYVVKVPIRAVSGPLESRPLEILLKTEQGLKPEDLLGDVSSSSATTAPTEVDLLRRMVNDEVARGETARSMTKPKWAYNKKFSGKPPAGYVCHSCGGRDHMRQQCPMGKQMHRPLGIPSSHLQHLPQGVDVKGSMIGFDGSRVMLRTDINAMINDPKKATESKVNEVEIPEELLCKVCNGLLRDAVIITCCSSFFCDDCIRSHLLDNDFMCPTCSKNMSPDQLISLPQIRTQVQKFRSNLPAGAKLVAPKLTTSQPQPDVGVAETPKAALQQTTATTTTTATAAAAEVTMTGPTVTEAVGGTGSGRSTPSASPAVLPEEARTQENSSGQVTPSPEEDSDSKPKSPQPAPHGSLNETSGTRSKGSSPLRVAPTDAVAPPAAQTSAGGVLTHPLLKQATAVAQMPFTNVLSPFRPLPFGGNVLQQTPAFPPAIRGPMLSSIIPGSQFPNHLASITQPISQSKPKPITQPILQPITHPIIPPILPSIIPPINLPPITQPIVLSLAKPKHALAPATQSAAGLPLSKEEFFKLQRSIRAERHKGKTYSSISRSSKRRKSSDSVSGSDSLSPYHSRGNSRARSRSRSRSPVGRAKSSSKRRRHEHKKSKSSKSSLRPCSSKPKKSKKRSASPTAQSSSSKRSKSGHSKPRSRNMLPIPEPETELVSGSSRNSLSVTPSPSPLTSTSHEHTDVAMVQEGVEEDKSVCSSTTSERSPAASSTAGDMEQGGEEQQGAGLDEQEEEKNNYNPSVHVESEALDDDFADEVLGEGEESRVEGSKSDSERLEESKDDEIEEGEVGDSDPMDDGDGGNVSHPDNLKIQSKIEGVEREISPELISPALEAPAEIVTPSKKGATKQQENDSEGDSSYEDSDASSGIVVSDISDEDSSLSESESESERRRKHKRRSKPSSSVSHRQSSHKPRRKRDSSHDRRRHGHNTRSTNHRARDKESDRERSRRHKDSRRKKRSRHSSEERSSRLKHKSRRSRKSKHRK